MVCHRGRHGSDKIPAQRRLLATGYNGAVVDSRARNDVHGAVQQQAKRQLEVFESNVPGGHLQVIKTHTVSSSRWTSNSSTGSGGAGDGCQRNTTNPAAATSVTNGQDLGPDFEDLKLSLNPLDVTSQKSKASVGRSVGRRPPSRPRVREEAFSSFNTHTQHTTTSNINNPHAIAAVNLHRVSRLCHQIHEHAVKQAFGERRHYFKSTKAVINKKEKFEKPPIHERESGDGVEIIEIESPNTSDLETNHSKLTRTKSSSSEDLHLISYENDKSNKSVEDLEDLEQLQSWRRTSKIRRSLQFPKSNKPASNKPPDLPENTGSVRRIREDLETGRRLNTALRGNSINLEALDQILQSISSSSSVQSDRSEKQDTPESESQIESKKDKRHSFVTVESLQEVKGRLRRTSCHTDDIYKDTDCRNSNMMVRKEEETDDGIGAEEYGTKGVANNNSSSGTSSARVRSYVYGLETMLNKKPILGTGSLESRTSKQTNANSINRNDDWYNRRKSYGFEKVHNEPDTNKSVSLKNKSVIESSTDSGICKSNDTMNLPPLIKSNGFKSTDSSPDGHSNTNETLMEKNINYTDYPPTSLGNVKRFSSIFEQNKDTFQKRNDDNTNSWNRNLIQKYRNDLEGTTVTIPIKSENYRRQLSSGSGTPSVTVNFSSDIKRHSIAVDEMKYVNNTFKVNETADEVTDEDNPNFNRKHKKVEFCKTEVHFAPDSGKINIIETDEKPPPTNTFRRRRRNSGSSYVEMIEECNKKGVPTLHFGDNYEKDVIHNHIQPHTPTENTVTVTTNGNIQEYFEISNEEKENSESDLPKGILKNKPIKPKPYILGDIDNSLQNTASPNSEIWGVRLKPVKKEEAPMWKSTVTLKNTTFDNNAQPKGKTMVTRSPKIENRNYNSSEFNENVEKIRIISSETEGNQKIESKGFSTKVNIGGSDLTFVQNAIVYNGFNNETHPSSWPKPEEINENIKMQTYNRSLVVRIGQNDKTTSQQLFDKDCDNSNNKTTTKITIDLTPSPTTEKSYDSLKKLPTTSIQEFKSTSLILNTFKTEICNRNDTVQRISDVKSSIPQQLEALKKLYEEALSDSEADKEVQLLMDQNGYESNKETDGECNSIVSGSWSKLRAYKLMNQEKNRSHLAIKSENALVGKDSRSHNSIGRIGYNQSNTRLPSNKENECSVPRNVQKQVPQPSNNYENKSFSNSKQSRTLTTSPDRNNSNMSPTLRGNEEHHYETLTKYRKSRSSSQERIYENDVHKNNTRSQNRIDRNVADKNRDKLSRSPSPSAHTSVKTPPPIACVVRNLRKSDMKYFGLKESTPPPIPDKYLKKKSNQEFFQTNVNRRLIPSENTHKNTHEKLQQKKESPQTHREKSETTSSSKYKISSRTKSPQRHAQKISSSQRKSDSGKRRSPLRKNSRPDSPIYENIDEVLDSSKNYTTDFDSSILEELTKAADQILQAVSDYADEESFSKLLSDEDANNRVKPEKLETISESKSWQQHSKTKGSRQKEMKTVKRTSSTSSVESTHEIRSASNTSKRMTDSDRYRKKSTESPAVRAATKARRLQRASSREALLLSHGSSSEDLPVKDETPLRKPRIVRKTKCTQLKITNGPDIQKRSTTSVKNYGNRICEDKAPVAALPEIRHKTAISTIRSTAEKMASREKANKLKTDDRKKLSTTSSKRDSIPVVAWPKSNKAKEISSSHRISTAQYKYEFIL
ncbi:probable serine/threonine-protein kinase DDB_G0282963 [Agrilus planipennis]|uniref:Probable serine/threonine-protein kinase DDB_G0282963 n=1 Tax=Agrilus planipennis TaxID=224129 RepID=A0A7F5R938_AGRPL|nr:probable serine/threonine-protein kinase DDB_G0282963 [Agrilus planipennis]